jgi:hypothetical protein
MHCIYLLELYSQIIFFNYILLAKVIKLMDALTKLYRIKHHISIDMLQYNYYLSYL